MTVLLKTIEIIKQQQLRKKKPPIKGTSFKVTIKCVDWSLNVTVTRVTFKYVTSELQHFLLRFLEATVCDVCYCFTCEASGRSYTVPFDLPQCICATVFEWSWLQSLKGFKLVSVSLFHVSARPYNICELDVRTASSFFFFFFANAHPHIRPDQLMLKQQLTSWSEPEYSWS